MLQQHHAVSGRSAHALTVSLARDANEVYEAQRLRYKVFAEEMGARLSSSEPGIDSDIYDPYCEHLIVRDPLKDQVVGTYRMLTGANARRLGGFCSDDEFDLTRLDHLRDQTVEVGRTCVHRDYRNGTVIALLWARGYAIRRAGGLSLFDRLRECEHGRRRRHGGECSLYAAKRLRKPARVSRVSPSGFAVATCATDGAIDDSAAHQRLRAIGRLYVRCAGVGSRFQYC